jgi:hypothetical protein
LAQDPEWADKAVTIVRKANQKKNAAARLKKSAVSLAENGENNA